MTRRLTALAAALACTAALASAGSAAGQAAPSGLTLVRDGNANAAIIWWSDDGSPVAQFAAAQLRTYVRRISGATVPVVRGSVDDTSGLGSLTSAVVIQSPPPPGPAIHIPPAWLEPVAERTASLASDGFAVVPEGSARLAMGGAGDRGTLYATDRLLTGLGVRFFAPDFPFYGGRSEKVPSQSTVVLPLRGRKEQPSLAYRRLEVAGGWSYTRRTLGELIDWMGKVGENVLAYPYDQFGFGIVTWDRWRDRLIPELAKRGIQIEVGGHGYQNFLPPKRYRPKHPDWFVEGANVFDVTKPAALKTYVANVVHYLAARPEIAVFSAWPPDDAVWPQDAVDKFGSIPNAQAFVTSRVQAGIQAAGLDVRVETIAYQSAFEPPDPGSMYDTSAIIDLTLYGRSYGQPVFGPANAYFAGLLERWRSAFGGDLRIYEYYRKYAWHSLPVVLPGLIGQEIPYYVAHGADGLSTYAEPADWLTFELTHALVAAMSWDDSIDPGLFVANELRDRFGAAASEMHAYLSAVAHAGRTLYVTAQGAYGDPDAVRTALADYRAARNELATALSTVPPDSTAAFLIGRLEGNADYAVADTELAMARLQGDARAIRADENRVAGLIGEHRLDGTVLEDYYSVHRYDRSATFRTTTWTYDVYRNAWP